jgi:Fe-S-cluster containining protein
MLTSQLYQVKQPCQFLDNKGCTLQGEMRPFCCRMFPLVFTGEEFALDPWAIKHSCYAAKHTRDVEAIAELFGKSIAECKSAAERWTKEAF